MSEIKTHLLNKIVVKPVIASGGEPDAAYIKGYDYIPLLYANILLVAKKKSGKTNVIYNLLDNLAGPQTTVYIFASTVQKDATYGQIMKLLKKKNIAFEAHTNFMDSKNKKNILTEILSPEDPDAEEEDPTKKFEYIKVGKSKKPLNLGLAVNPERQWLLSPYNSTEDVVRQTWEAERQQRAAAGRPTPFGTQFRQYHSQPQLSSTWYTQWRQQHPNTADPRMQRLDQQVRDGFVDRNTLRIPGRDFETYIGIRKDKTFREFGPVNFGVPELRYKKGLQLSAIREETPEEAKADAEKPKSGKQIAPETIFVFDDLGSDLRNPSISQLVKTNRHEKCKVILSTQYITDLQPQALKQIDFCMLFKAFGEDKLQKMHELFDLSVPWKSFLALYHYATESPFSFLFIDVRSEKFRMNFNVALDMPELSSAAAAKAEERALPEEQETEAAERKGKGSRRRRKRRRLRK
jgi:hypothetical protein